MARSSTRPGAVRAMAAPPAAASSRALRHEAMKMVRRAGLTRRSFNAPDLPAQCSLHRCWTRVCDLMLRGWRSSSSLVGSVLRWLAGAATPPDGLRAALAPTRVRRS